MRISLGLVAVFVVVDVLFKLGVLPLGVLLVPTTSMVPVIKPLDLVVAEKKPFHVGDVVVWCQRLYCIVHRVIEIKHGYIVTKGDANTVADRPVPATWVRGVAVYIVPRWAWLPVFAALVAWDYRSYVRALLRSRSSLWGLVALVYVSGVALALAASLALRGVGLGELGYLQQPYMSLRYIGFRGCGVLIDYVPHGVSIGAVDRVWASVPVTSYWFNETSIYVGLDPAQLSRLSAQGPGLVTVGFNASLGRGGYLVASYALRVPFHPPVFRLQRDRLLVENPNCYPVKICVEVLYALRPGPWSRAWFNTTILPGGETLWLPPARYMRLWAGYVHGGSCHGSWVPAWRGP